ncbi:MAG TPA: thioredoxin domain-containing protein, partial [Candidatus Acidoferrales bacterium]
MPEKVPEKEHSAANRLAHSASPYLRTAANQPVDWHEWGSEAFERARAEDKPILLDIGAVWCHWCHVIDRESYEDPELAALINRLFVAVKVDRDERPDVDTRYQTAVNAISGQGGWPLTGFLLPDGRPFYGGTYFPPADAMGRPSFRRVLESIAETFRTRRREVEEAANALVGAVSQAEVFAAARGDWSAQIVDAQIAGILQRFDARQGGFGRGPKFPHSAAIDLILERYQATHDQQLLQVAQTTLEKMARGGVYDQLAGGFHRYSVDERWLVPHFEKMSYDNSELLKNYVHAYQVTRNPLFREVAAGIVGWVDAVLSDREAGGFYASQDADISLDDDGDYFTWTVDEVRAVLSAEDARVIELYYDVGPAGEMHHNPAKNVLWVARESADIARTLGISEADVNRTLVRARAQLLAARERRPTPYVDTTLYTSWNAMFVSAYLEAAQLLDAAPALAENSAQAPAYCRAFALRTLDRFLAEAWDDRRGFAHRLGG